MTPTTTATAAAPDLAPDGTAYYDVRMSGAQIYAFAALVRRLGWAPAVPAGLPGADRQLRDDLHQALQQFVDLTPEPSDADAQTYLAAVAAGTIPGWEADDRPLTSTPVQLADAIRARVTGGGR